jgi:hypothetical protein
MAKRKRTRKHVESDLATFLMRWHALDWKRTVKTGGGKLFRHLVLKNFVNASIPGVCNYRDLVEQIAGQCSTPIQIEHLSERLNHSKVIRGRVVFGSPGNFFDQIAETNEAAWWISAKGLNIRDAQGLESICSPFDKLVGGIIMREKKKSNDSNRWLPKDALREVARSLDENGFKLLDNLEPSCRRELARWNQGHQQDPIRTFAGALSSGKSWLQRGVKLRFYRAKSRYLGIR